MKVGDKVKIHMRYSDDWKPQYIVHISEINKDTIKGPYQYKRDDGTYGKLDADIGVFFMLEIIKMEVIE